MAYGQGVNLTTAQTIAGVKTFSSSPIVPTPTTGDQVANKQYADLKVALEDFTGTNVNLTENGYQKLPSGLIIQWGTYSGATGGTITFPLAFPSFCASVVITTRGYGLSSLGNSAPTKTSFSWHDSGYAEGLGIKWIAIGY